MLEIEAIMAQSDTARQNRKITLNRNTNLNNRSSPLEATREVKIGKVKISNGRQEKSISGNIFTEIILSKTQHSAVGFECAEANVHLFAQDNLYHLPKNDSSLPETASNLAALCKIKMK